MGNEEDELLDEVRKEEALDILNYKLDEDDDVDDEDDEKDDEVNKEAIREVLRTS